MYVRITIYIAILVIKMSEILQFTTQWIQPGTVMLSEKKLDPERQICYSDLQKLTEIKLNLQKLNYYCFAKSYHVNNNIVIAQREGHLRDSGDQESYVFNSGVRSECAQKTTHRFDIPIKCLHSMKKI